MKHTLIEMITPEGSAVKIPETKVEKMLNRGYEMAIADSTKITKVEESHDEIVENEDDL